MESLRNGSNKEIGRREAGGREHRYGRKGKKLIKGRRNSYKEANVKGQENKDVQGIKHKVIGQWDIGDLRDKEKRAKTSIHAVVVR